MVFSTLVVTANGQDFTIGDKVKSMGKAKRMPTETIEKKASEKLGDKKPTQKRRSKTGGRISYEEGLQEIPQDAPKELTEMNDYELEVKASKGNVNAQAELGLRWVFGDYVIDLLKGMGWLKKASENNHSGAQAVLGYCYYCLDEKSTAGYYYRKSADNGNPIGQYLMGLAYENGECGVNQNLLNAANMFVAAARQGHPAAQYAIGLYLYIGEYIGIQRDLKLSKAWMQEAAKNDNKDAKDFLKKFTFTEEAADAFVEYLRGYYEEESTEEEEEEEEPVTTSKKSTPTPGIEVGRTVMTDIHIWTLKSVEVKKDQTICHWSVVSRVPNTQVWGTSSAYITAGSSSKRYYVEKCIGISMDSEKTTIRKQGDEVEFSAVFPALPKRTKRISYYGSSDVQITDIDISTK